MIFFSIYNKFKLRRWSKYSAGKRQQLLEKVEIKQAKKLKREPLPVVINDNPNWNCYGMFEVNGGKKVLYLSINLITHEELRFHALETIMHEGRHAYQYELTNKKDLGFFDFRARRWKQNYGGYITSTEDKVAYGMQPIERDAQRYAIRQLSQMKFRFYKEEDYNLTLESMKYRYETTLKQMKEQNGIFYKYKMYRAIKHKSEN